MHGGRFPSGDLPSSVVDIAMNSREQSPGTAQYPGIAILFVVPGFNLPGDGLPDALGPRDT